MKTPYFTVSPSKIVENYRMLAEMLPVEGVYYATKPNSENITLRTLVDIGGAFEINSANEMKILLKMGARAENIICSRPIKTTLELREMYNYGCRYFVYDDISEYKNLFNYSPEALKIARINICDISSGDIDYGMETHTIKRMIEENMIPDGYTFYVLNTKERNDIFRKICSRVEELLKLHRPDQSILINLGGNHPLPSSFSRDYYKCLYEITQKLRNVHSNIHFIAEPGRSVVNNAFDLVTTILLIKKNINIYVDAHSQILKLPPMAIYPISEVEACNPFRVSFYESLCSNYKLFDAEINFRPSPGTRLLLKSCGSYSICFANHFHSTGKPKIVIKDQ